MGIKTTGNSQIDTATAELALALRAGHPGRPDQYYYDWAMRLRDEIRAGQQVLDAEHRLPPWRPAVNGTGRAPYFLIRGYGTESDEVPNEDRYYTKGNGQLVRFVSMENAQRVADKLNAAETP